MTNNIASIRRENLRRLVERDGLSLVAKHANKPARQLNDMLAGRKSFGEKVARAIELEMDPSRPPGWLDTQPPGCDENHTHKPELSPSANTQGASALPKSHENNKEIQVRSSAVVRAFPKDFPKEDGYIRMELMSPRPSAGRGAAVAEVPYIVRHLDVLETWARQVLGCVDPSRVKILTCNGDSMETTINDQDIVFVDMGQAQFSRPGIYVLSVDDDMLIKRLNKKVSGELEIISDNTTHYRTETITARDAATLNISGRVLGWWTLRKS